MLPVFLKQDLVWEVVPYTWIMWPALDQSWCWQVVHTILILLTVPIMRMLVCDVTVSAYY